MFRHTSINDQCWTVHIMQLKSRFFCQPGYITNIRFSDGYASLMTSHKDGSLTKLWIKPSSWDKVPLYPTLHLAKYMARSLCFWWKSGFAGVKSNNADGWVFIIYLFSINFPASFNLACSVPLHENTIDTVCIPSHSDSFLFPSQSLMYHIWMLMSNDCNRK